LSTIRLVSCTNVAAIRGTPTGKPISNGSLKSTSLTVALGNESSMPDPRKQRTHAVVSTNSSHRRPHPLAPLPPLRPCRRWGAGAGAGARWRVAGEGHPPEHSGHGAQDSLAGQD